MELPGKGNQDKNQKTHVMKSLLFVALLILVGCSSANRIYEDQLYVTKKYVGCFIKQVPLKKRIEIVTMLDTFSVVGHPVLDIPAEARCYVKYSPERRAGTIRRFWILYFTWDGTDDLYMVGQNPYTGEIY